MPLDDTGLQDELEALFANPSPAPSTLAQQWRAALEAYAVGITPASTTVAAASTALQAALAAAYASPDPASVPALVDTALMTWAAAIGVGMAPAFVAVPPPVAPIAIGLSVPPTVPATHAAAAAKWAGVLDAWMKTGTATPPVGPSVSWS